MKYWSAKEIAQIIVLVKEKTPRKTIGAFFGTNYSSVSGIINKIRKQERGQMNDKRFAKAFLLSESIETPDVSNVKILPEHESASRYHKQKRQTKNKIEGNIVAKGTASSLLTLEDNYKILQDGINNMTAAMTRFLDNERVRWEFEHQDLISEVENLRKENAKLRNTTGMFAKIKGIFGAEVSQKSSLE